MVKAVRLGVPGEPPKWGRDGGSTPIDGQIEAARHGSVDEQRALFFGCARFLYDNRLRDQVEERDDPEDNDQWLADLAIWFGWSDELREEVKKEALRDAARVLPHEDPTWQA